MLFRQSNCNDIILLNRIINGMVGEVSKYVMNGLTISMHLNRGHCLMDMNPVWILIALIQTEIILPIIAGGFRIKRTAGIHPALRFL